MSSATNAMADGVAELMAFFGLGPEDLLQARANLAGQGMAANGAGAGREDKSISAPRLRRWRMPAPLAVETASMSDIGSPAIRPGPAPISPACGSMLLGPPRDEALLKKTFATNEVYHLAANDAGHNAFFGAAALGGSEHDRRQR